MSPEAVELLRRPIAGTTVGVSASSRLLMYCSCLLALLCGMALTSPGSAAERWGNLSVELQTSGVDADCVDERQFIKLFVEYLGNKNQALVPELEIGAHIAASARGVVGTVSIRQSAEKASLTREIHGASCEEVADGLALVVALSVEPMIERAETQNSRARRQEPTTEQVAKASPSPPAPPPVDGGDDVRWHVGIGAIGNMGLLPTASAGSVLWVGAQSSALNSSGLELRLGWLPHSRAILPQGEVTFESWSLHAALCVRALRAAQLQLGLCAEGGVYGTLSRSQGFAEDRKRTVWTPSARAEAYSRFYLSDRFFAHLALRASFLFQRPTWIVRNLTVVHESEPILGEASLGLGLFL